MNYTDMGIEESRKVEIISIGKCVQSLKTRFPPVFEVHENQP